MRQTDGDKRLELHEKLCDFLGSRNVYYQPPETVKLRYPCIIYSLNFINHRYSDDLIYMKDNEYQLMLITKDPDDNLLEKMSWFRTARFERSYIRDNLYHYLFRLYY